MRPGTASVLPGVAALAGGLVWVTHTLLLAARPLGCVGEECFGTGRHHRESEDLAWVLLASVVLLTVSAASALGQERKGARAWLTAASAFLAGGAALLVLGLIMNAAVPGGSALWWLHDSDTLGRLLPVAGTLLLGIGMLRSQARRRLPWVLVVSALAAVPVNIQDERVLLSVPVGLAWAALGLWLLRGSQRRVPTAEVGTSGHGAPQPDGDQS